VNYQSRDVDTIFDMSMRIGLIVVFFAAISYASEYMRRSEKRLLKLFNTLNRRTSELEKSQAQLEMIYENTRILASILDTDGVVKEVVRIMGEVLQYECHALIFRDRWGNCYYRARSQRGRHNFHLKAIDLEAEELLARVCKIGEPVSINDIRTRDDYTAQSTEARAVMLVPLVSHGSTNGVLVAESNEVAGFKGKHVQMISVVARSAALALENAELHKRTEELTIIDELTETYNYRFFVQKLEEEKRRALRYNLPLSLVMVDIDFFKKFNDSYGHETGNVVLRHLSAIIKKCIRDVDFFVRYGGEEFAVILPQTASHEARTIGERIRSQVERTAIEAGKAGHLRITVSVGVSSFPENGKSHEELVSVTDQALYRAKGEGRNLVCTK
ncbi:MAG: diguanylate cyclase, partial [candidate division Zixibacteria bacterium]|nr:diguanylate cyclase [candidate division Zixibacteria bacterium]